MTTETMRGSAALSSHARDNAEPRSFTWLRAESCTRSYLYLYLTSTPHTYLKLYLASAYLSSLNTSPYI